MCGLLYCAGDCGGAFYYCGGNYGGDSLCADFYVVQEIVEELFTTAEEIVEELFALKLIHNSKVCTHAKPVLDSTDLFIDSWSL